jgi:general secretion pathway protein H
MVVMVLIGIIFSFAVLSLGGDDLAEAMEQETRRLVTLIGMANDEAVVRGEEIAIYFTDDGYSFLVLQAGRWQEQENDRLLKPYTLPAGITISIEVEGDPPGLGKPDDDEDDKNDDDEEEDSLTPQVFILSSGELTPFSATLQADQSLFRYHLTASLLGELKWEVEEVF